MEYSEKMYKLLNDAYMDANRICPPDEYQFRQNRLCRQIAALLLEPYEQEFHKKQKIKAEE